MKYSVYDHESWSHLEYWYVTMSYGHVWNIWYVAMTDGHIGKNQAKKNGKFNKIFWTVEKKSVELKK